MLMQLEADEREAFVAVLRQRGLSDGDFEVISGSLTVTAPALLSMDDAPQYGPLTEVVVVRSRHTAAEARYTRGSGTGSWIRDFARDLDALAFWPRTAPAHIAQGQPKSRSKPPP